MDQKYCIYGLFKQKNERFYPLFSWIKRGLNIWLVTFSFLNVFYGKAVYEHYCLGIPQHYTRNIGAVLRKFKSTLLQAFVVQGKTAPLPVQQFYLVTPPVYENENIATAGVVAQYVLHQSR